MFRWSSRWTPSACCVGIAALIVALPSCKPPTGNDGIYYVVGDSMTLFALNGSPVGAPTAIDLFSGVTFQASETLAFDLAFDINADGNAVIIPPGALATAYSMPHDVGLELVPEATFRSLTSAPTSGYRLDTALVAKVGSVIAIESYSPSCQSAAKGQLLFGKIAISAVDRSARTISIELAVDRECGSHGLGSGTPNP